MKNILVGLLLTSFATSAYAIGPVVSVPESSSLMLLAFGLLGLFLTSRKK